jgi:hypothetical protein
MTKYLIGAIVMFSIVFCACDGEKTEKPKVNKTEVRRIQKNINIEIKRYEKELNSIPKNDLKKGLITMKKDYHCFLGDNPDSPENVKQIQNYLNDKIIKQLYQEVQKQFPDLTNLEKEFNAAFALLKYHFPEAKIPNIYSVITGMYYEMPIMFYDSILAISLDMYLGKNFKLYKQLGPSVPQYIIQRFSKEYILPDCFKEISYKYIQYKPTQGTLLDEMLLEGKRLLFAEAVLPQLSDTIIFPCSPEKMQWLNENEAKIWAYLIEKNYLYTKDNVVIQKLVHDAPFTSMFGQKSPGRTGAWIGWQICKSWLQKNPNKSIKELMNQSDAQKILTESKYKPKR